MASPGAVKVNVTFVVPSESFPVFTCDEAMARKKAGDYAAQRDVYVSAAEGISGREVDRFAFQFSRAECQVSAEISEELRQEIGAHMTHALEHLEADDPAMTATSRECYFCGDKKVGWCPGVEPVTRR